MLMPRTSSRRYMSEQEGISMIMVSTEEVPGRTITKTLGVVSGSTVRAKHVGKDIGAFFKNIGGGELKAYTNYWGNLATKLCNECWRKLLDEVPMRLLMLELQLAQLLPERVKYWLTEPRL